ncbi:hypothetical protein EVAR_45915_1 [Eumeta japonica]|uniref:Uncharacterized protein n=1 Tax=Eumeta variegata TaxID=151549 RepID=A0A4C1W8M5_EUMVA|nr:hypothetical protein EVAR_45915_1 [Eumeta japonica]
MYLVDRQTEGRQAGRQRQRQRQRERQTRTEREKDTHAQKHTPARTYTPTDQSTDPHCSPSKEGDDVKKASTLMTDVFAYGLMVTNVKVYG